MHKLINIAVALLLGLLLASAPDGRDAAAQYVPEVLTGPGGFSNPFDMMVDIFFPRNSPRKESNSKDAAAVQQTRQPGFGIRVAPLPSRSKLKNQNKRRNARRSPPSKDNPWAFLIADLPDLSAYGGLSGYRDPDPFIQSQFLRDPLSWAYGGVQ